MLVTKPFLFPLTSIVWTKNTTEVNEIQNAWLPTFFIFICVLQKKESHTGLVRQEGE